LGFEKLYPPIPPSPHLPDLLAIALSPPHTTEATMNLKGESRFAIWDIIKEAQVSTKAIAELGDWR
jgi:hypothetical protein